MFQQISQLISSLSTLTLVTIMAVVVIIVGAAIFFIFTEIVGSNSKVENVMSHYNRALSAWCAFAVREEMHDAYPVGIEIEAEKAPFGIIVKKVTVIAKNGFAEARYRLVRDDEKLVHFEREEPE